MRVEIYVRPAASRALVGGARDGVLVVQVVAAAHEGRANVAALEALASALDLPASRLYLVHGTKSHRKLVDITADGADSLRVKERLAVLRAQ